MAMAAAIRQGSSLAGSAGSSPGAASWALALGNAANFAGFEEISKFRLQVLPRFAEPVHNVTPKLTMPLR